MTSTEARYSWSYLKLQSANVRTLVNLLQPMRLEFSNAGELFDDLTQLAELFDKFAVDNNNRAGSDISWDNLHDLVTGELEEVGKPLLDGGLRFQPYSDILEQIASNVMHFLEANEPRRYIMRPRFSATFEPIKGQPWQPEDIGSHYADQQIHCVCRKPHDGRFMVECDRCFQWFHGDCVGVDEDDDVATWLCGNCKSGSIERDQDDRPPSKRQKTDHCDYGVVVKARKGSNCDELTVSSSGACDNGAPLTNSINNTTEPPKPITPAAINSADDGKSEESDRAEQQLFELKNELFAVHKRMNKRRKLKELATSIADACTDLSELRNENCNYAKTRQIAKKLKRAAEYLSPIPQYIAESDKLYDISCILKKMSKEQQAAENIP